MKIDRRTPSASLTALVLGAALALPAVAGAHTFEAAQMHVAVPSDPGAVRHSTIVVRRSGLVLDRDGVIVSGRGYSANGYRHALPQDLPAALRASSGLNAAAVHASPAQLAAAPGDGFDWVDAGIGAAAGLTATLLAASAWRLRQRGPAPA
jgi:hypothetical protein